MRACACAATTPVVSSFSRLRVQFSNVLPLHVQVIAALPWIWPVSVASIPAGGNTTDAGSCLDPDSDHYLDCCDEYGVALKPYWILVVSSLIFAFLLGTPKSTLLLRAQIEAELPERQVAKALKEEAKAAGHHPGRWVYCASCCPSSLDYCVGTGTAERASKAKAKGVEAKAAEALPRAARWTQWKEDFSCCRDIQWCCPDYAAEQPRVAAARPNAEIEAALTKKTQKRDRWVWFALGIQLLHAIVSTIMLVLELRARGLQGWELYQAATLLSFNSTLGGYLAAVYGVRLHMGAPATESGPAKTVRELWAKQIRDHRDRVPDKCPDRKPYNAVIWCASVTLTLFFGRLARISARHPHTRAA